MKRVLNHALYSLLLFMLPLVFAISCLNGPSDGSFLSVNREQCTACGECSNVCATDAIRIFDNKAVIDPSECVECGKCVEACPEDAIQ